LYGILLTKSQLGIDGGSGTQQEKRIKASFLSQIDRTIR